MSRDLEIIDYQSLLLMIAGKKPAWDMTSLKRCIDAQVVTPTGGFMTCKGSHKAKVLRDAVERLRAGLPIEARNVSRSLGVRDKQWHRTEIDGEAWSICSQAAIRGKLDSSAPFTALSQDLKNELYNHKNALAMKLIPYAVQIDEFGHGEFICFHGVTERNKIKRRMQSTFYDYIVENFNSPTFWSRDNTQTIIVKRGLVSKSNRFGGIIAVVQGVKLDRAFPPRSNCYGMVKKIAGDTQDQQPVDGGDHSEE